MTDQDQRQLGKTLWNIADQLRGAMNADDFRDYMLSFLFLRYLSDNYETAAKKELGKDYPTLGADDRRVPLAIWYVNNPDDITEFEKQMRRKVHYVIQPAHLWNSIANLARTQSGELLNTLQAGFKYIENESFESTFNGLFSEINLGSDKLGRKYEDRNSKLCTRFPTSSPPSSRSTARNPRLARKTAWPACWTSPVVQARCCSMCASAWDRTASARFTGRKKISPPTTSPA